ncbi:hypothetical protein BC739_000077 [Kutzneria viridogrisea]|uniref:DJ-1/PfpI domain-containing protein n=1 Tax=Kutzneria viridogrisea TaxID=47990 RepID=A0ABR6B7P6_9PSEU|nr:hypothetical protein [Kutzneria viridogrisea]
MAGASVELVFQFGVAQREDLNLVGIDANGVLQLPHGVCQDHPQIGHDHGDPLGQPAAELAASVAADDRQLLEVGDQRQVRRARPGSSRSRAGSTLRASVGGARSRNSSSTSGAAAMAPCRGRAAQRPPWSSEVLVDGNLITGQNPQSSRATADRVVQVLERREIFNNR